MSWSFSHRLAEMAKRVEASVVGLKFGGKKNTDPDAVAGHIDCTTASISIVQSVG
jgi:aspartate aminotransferase-like enzyme